MPVVDPVRIAAEEYDAVTEAAWYQVDLEDFTLDFYFRPSSVPRAYVFSPGWVDRTLHPYPYFQRIKWFDRLEGVGISLADPTLMLSPDVQVGWFVGTSEVDYAYGTARYLSGLLGHLGVPATETLFFGSSAGGFASLAFAAHVRGASVLACNPQTHILHFHEARELSRMTRAAFGPKSLIELQELFGYRISIAELWRTKSYIPPGLIMVNSYDSWHLEQHVIPLMASLSSADISKALDIRIFSDPEAGHDPPSADALIPALQQMGGDR